jgi:hypothetical protein
MHPSPHADRMIFVKLTCFYHHRPLHPDSFQVTSPIKHAFPHSMIHHAMFYVRTLLKLYSAFPDKKPHHDSLSSSCKMLAMYGSSLAFYGPTNQLSINAPIPSPSTPSMMTCAPTSNPAYKINFFKVGSKEMCSNDIIISFQPGWQ